MPNIYIPKQEKISRAKIRSILKDLEQEILQLHKALRDGTWTPDYENKKRKGGQH